MRVTLVVAGSAAAIFGLGVVLPSFAADLRSPPSVAEYDDYEEEAPPPVAVAPVPPVPVVAPPVYVYGGDDYCWFERGWNGAGWYVCDYGPWIKGAWWGGPAGWNGWVWRGGPRFYDRPYGRRFGYGPPRGYPRGGYGFRRDFADGGYGGYGGRGGHGGGRHWGGGRYTADRLQPSLRRLRKPAGADPTAPQESAPGSGAARVTCLPGAVTPPAGRRARRCAPPPHRRRSEPG
jgi:hypothetical protein